MNHFVVFATDRADAVALREQTRTEHRRYLRNPGSHPVRVLLGGPTLEQSGLRMNGSMLVVAASSVEAVSSFVADDPYAKAGLFAFVEIRPWKCGLGRYDVPEEP